MATRRFHSKCLQLPASQSQSANHNKSWNIHGTFMEHSWYICYHLPTFSWSPTLASYRSSNLELWRPTDGNSLPVAVTCHWWRSSGEKMLTHLFRKGIIFLCSLCSPGKVAKNVGLTLAHRPHPPTSHGHMARADDEHKIQRTQQRMQFHPGLSKMGPAFLATIPWEKQD